MSVYDFAEIMKGKKAEERAAASGGEKPASAKTEKPEKQPEAPKKAEGKQEKPKGPEQPKRRGRPPKEDKDKAAAPKPKAPASHVLDHAMAFDNAAADDSLFPGMDIRERERMATVIYETFARFFDTGTPGRPGGVEWKPLSEEQSVLAFDERIRLRPLTDVETLDGFPQSVFRLNGRKGVGA